MNIGISSLIFRSRRKRKTRGISICQLDVIKPELLETNYKHIYVLPLIGYDEVNLFMRIGSINCRVVVRISPLIFDVNIEKGTLGLREKPEIEVLGIYNSRTNKPLGNVRTVKISLVGYEVEASRTNNKFRHKETTK